VTQHRAGPHSAGSHVVDPSGGRGGLHRAERVSAPSRLHQTCVRAIQSVPTLIGTGVMVIAAVGALVVPSAAPQLAAAGTARLSPVPGSSGAGSVVSSAALDRRERAVSRDSQREALADAADEKLQAATEEEAQQRNAALKQLAASAEKQAGIIAKDAWQLPVTPGAYRLTARFGACSGLWSHCHTGLDFAAPTGTPIHAVANGTVTEVGSAGAYGNRTIMTLPDGTELWYCHQSAFAVTVGQKVVAGQVIGAVGSTGNTTGPHVHLEVRPGAGDPVDPYAALVQHGLKP